MTKWRIYMGGISIRIYRIFSINFSFSVVKVTNCRRKFPISPTRVTMNILNNKYEKKKKKKKKI